MSVRRNGWTTDQLTLINIVPVVHAAKSGRFSPWGYIILMMPGIGAIAYVAQAERLAMARQALKV